MKITRQQGYRLQVLVMSMFPHVSHPVCSSQATILWINTRSLKTIMLGKGKNSFLGASYVIFSEGKPRGKKKSIAKIM